MSAAAITYHFVQFEQEIVKFEHLKIVRPTLISAPHTVLYNILTHRHFEQRPPQETGIILVPLQSPRRVLVMYVI